MKRWIPATCVALLCGAAFGQACEKSQSCSEQTAAAVSLVKADTDCGTQGDCPHPAVAVVAVSETKSCCAEGQSVAAAIIAVAATKDAGCSAAQSECAKSTAVLTKVAATDTKACSADQSGCTKGTAVLTKVAATNDQTCSQGTTCSQTAAAVTTVAGPANKTCPISGRPVAANAVASYNGKEIGFCNTMCAEYFDKSDDTKKAAVYQTIAASFQTADVKTAPCCEDAKGACCTDAQAKVTAASYTDGPINKTCPMSGKPISDAALVKYNGKTIGFCGEGCATNFNGATAEQQEKVYTTILASQPKDDGDIVLVEDGPAYAVKEIKSDPYTLDTCAVLGGKLGEMGDPITKVVNGREVKFCCAGCVPKYEADPAKYNAKIDAQLIKQQLPYYPAQTCAVRGTPLMVDGKDVGKNIIVNNRLVRVCCANCAAKLKADPTAFLAKLDQAVIAKQTKDYPLDTCIVRESSELGAMGEPVQLVSGNRLIKFCCKGCVAKFKKNPAAFIAKLDKAWAEKYPEMFKVAQVEPAPIEATKIISAGG